MASTRLGYLAIGVETTKDVAVRPSVFVRYKSGSVNTSPEIIKTDPIMGVRDKFV